jgi:hypothetical protein
MADAPQSYKNHTRTDPAYHFVLVGLILLSLFVSVLALTRKPSIETIALTLLALTLAWNTAMTRTYPLKVQDRVIRLEERLRLTMLLPEAERARIAELTPRQLVALRFASDAELPSLALRAANEKLSSKEIKAAIGSWRADTLRV